MSVDALSIEIRSQRLGDALKVLPIHTLDEISLGVSRAAKEVARRMRKNAPKAFSTLAQSIKDTTEGPLAKSVSPHVAYAEYVEQGSDSGGRPPIDALTDWIKVKGITPLDPNMDEEDLAFVMQDSIAFNGVLGQPYAAPTAMQMRPRVEQILDDSLSRAMAKAGLQ